MKALNLQFLNNWRSQIARMGTPMTHYPGPGIYHYLRQTREGKARIHLRLEEDGSGLLLVNASRVFHLNPTAACMAYFRLEGVDFEDAVAALTRRFHVSKVKVRQDYIEMADQIDVIAHPDEHCALCELDLDVTAPFSARPSAPYRMDLALTYRCNNNCAHCYNARPRQQPELSTEDWKLILDRLWEACIPHVVFTGGESTLRADLPELIAHAEANGQITGLNTNGRKLKDAAYLQTLVDAGLDHVQITLESHDAAIHDDMVKAAGAWQDTVAGVRNALATRLYVMTNTTLLQPNAALLTETLDFLAEVGVPTVGLNALIYSGKGLLVDSGLPERELPPLLTLARAKTEEHGQKLIWYTPTQYCHFDPVQMELGVKGCTAALYNMCVEPDGSVIPCQSYYHAIGNMLRDPWNSIWNHDLSVGLRERRDLPLACHACALLVECGGGCPLARQANPELKPETVYASHKSPLREAL
jgi:radical SAM protein with 4Fe4S-binding SPASM domain